MTQEDWLQAQYSVLGAALLDPVLVPKILHQTRRSDFSGHCQTVYAAMCKVFQSGTPVDPVTVRDALTPQYGKFLAQLMQVTPTTANIDYYIRLCREQSRILSIRDLALQLTTAEDSNTIRQLLEKANAFMVDKPGLNIVTMADALRSFMDRHTGDVEYMCWPIQELNDRLYAEPGEFILLGGRPSTGKSAFAIQCAKLWAKTEKVGFFSLETNQGKLFDRAMSSMTDLTMDQIKRNQISQDAWDRICSMVGDITGLQLEIIPAAGMTTADIRSVTMMQGYKIIIIDYVQLIQSAGFNRTEQVTNVSMELHRMAQDMGVTVIGLCQLKRRENGKSDKSNPDSSDLRESGQLEQDADIILILQLENEDDPQSFRKLFVSKNKEGTTPMVKLTFDGQHQTFTKAHSTGEVVSKYVADGKKARRKNASEAAEARNQMTLLPEDTKVPFE